MLFNATETKDKTDQRQPQNQPIDQLGKRARRQAKEQNSNRLSCFSALKVAPPGFSKRLSVYIASENHFCIFCDDTLHRNCGQKQANIH